tara:strand:+ start:53 stop:451 length:399 start_codon:yes stop_codon:yes gene_type:complete
MNDKFEVINLWQKCKLCVPWNDPYKDISRKMNVLPELFLVGITDGNIVATVMGGYDGHRGWINYLAVHPKYQKNGFARKILESLENKLKLLGCPKVNLQIRNGNNNVISFYEKMGFIDDKVINMGKRLQKDN